MNPNIDKLQAAIIAIGPNPGISYQLRDATFDGTVTGFYTVTYYPMGAPRCAIGQGDTLSDAITAARADAAAMLAKVSIADVERAAA